MQRTATSIASGIGTPVLLAALSVLFGMPGSWVPGTSLLILAGAVFLVLGISLLPAIILSVYLKTVVASVPAAVLLWALPGILRDPTSQNQIGLVVVGSFLGALLISAVVLPLHAISRRLRLPAWAAGVSLALCPTVFYLVGARGRQISSDAAAAAKKRMAEIWDAEREYAARNPGHGFTCVGTNLPGVSGLSWRPDSWAARDDRSIALDNNYWFKLDCSSGVFELRAYPAWGSGNAGPRYFFEGRRAIAFALV